jgi:hypothetical protein
MVDPYPFGTADGHNDVSENLHSLEPPTYGREVLVPGIGSTRADLLRSRFIELLAHFQFPASSPELINSQD